MAILQWDQDTERVYYNGVSKPVLFVGDGVGGYGDGVAWNGLVSANEKPSGGDSQDLFANNRKYGVMISPEKFGGTIEAYTFPEEWMAAIGFEEPTPGMIITGQRRLPFCVSYQRRVNSDAGEDVAYEIHIIYGCLAKPAESKQTTTTDSPEAEMFSWEYDSVPVQPTATGLDTKKPVSKVVLNSADVPPAKLATLEEQLYGTAITAPVLPTVDSIYELLTAV